ncbi:ABC transporter permease [Consotaella aegiceratis]|uniref:ABC transporter permease n=1 Tax=Consotaella aegiceratis TaxID=3097961 RepID=UPI002F3EDC9F
MAVGLMGILAPAFGYLPALGGTDLSLAPFRHLLAMPGLWQSAALSFAVGLATTLIALLSVLGFVAAFSGTAFFRFARQVLGPMLAVPHAAAAFGFALIVAPSGLLFRLAALPFGWSRPPDLLIVGDPLGLAMMAGLIVKEVPFLLLVVFAALPQADPVRRLRLARSLGYGRMAGFILGVWPEVYRQIRLPVLAVAAFASSVVDVALILGPTTPAPLAVRLLKWMGDPDLAMRFMASAGALLQLGITLAVLATWMLLERLGNRVCRLAVHRGARMVEDRVARGAAGVPITLATLALCLGLLGLALWSVAGFWAFPALWPPSLSPRAWMHALDAAAGPLRTTAVVGLCAAGLALVLVVALLESLRHSASSAASERRQLPRFIAGLLYLPLIVPQIAFVFGLQITALALGLKPSLALLVVVHLVFVAPYVALALADPWFSLDPRFERMGASLGRSKPAVFLHIRLPLLLAPALTAAAIGFAVSVGQYLPTVLIGAGRLPTITTEAVASASGGDRRIIGAYGLLQTALPFLAFALATAAPALLYRHRRGMRPG